MSNKWSIDIEDKVFSLVKAKTIDAISEDYPDVFYTMDSINTIEPTFPTIYFRYIDNSEKGADLEGTDINAILLTVDVKVIVSAEMGMESAKEIQGYIMDCFKAWSFKSMSYNSNQSDSDVKISVARYSRLIGASDNLS